MDDCTIIIIGITGDLARRKLIPALYKLVVLGKLDSFVLIGAALQDTTIEKVLEDAQQYIHTIDQEAWSLLHRSSYYVRVNATHAPDFASMRDTVCDIEQTLNLPGNRLLYCATPSDLFCPITQHAIQSGLIQRTTKRPWHRIVYEKPFGHNALSAHQINQCISLLLDEQQIYRIDHYLTEELVSNIAMVRFTNCIFEPLWNNRYIAQVQIILNEKLCIGNRGAYYDTYGALKDMVQNHMLELLALISMEPPKRLTGEYIREARAEVLKHVKVIDGLRAQYEGYLEEPYVNPHSDTETFVIAKLMIDNPRWAGVPFFLKTGKGLEKKDTAIYIQFKKVDCILHGECPNEPNCLTIQVTPNPSFFLTLNVKKPGFTQEAIPVRMEFCHSCVFKEHSAESYEVIFDQVIRGEHAVSVRFDEIEYAWNIVDTLHAMHIPLLYYKRGSKGPVEVEEFELKHKMRWLA
jgi:glucose-6-phosphate 1-dehydrogenase